MLFFSQPATALQCSLFEPFLPLYKKTIHLKEYINTGLDTKKVNIVLFLVYDYARQIGKKGV